MGRRWRAFRRTRLLRRIARMPETHRWAAGGVVCFHCGKWFQSPWRVRLHFGATPDERAACVVKPKDVERMRRRIHALETDLARAAGELERLGLGRTWPSM